MEELQQPKSSIIGVLLTFLLIGILASASVFLLNESRMKARDAKRLVDVKRLSTALEFYNLEHSSFPIVEKPIQLGTSATAKLCDAKSGAFVESIVSCETEYTKSGIPLDPSGNLYTYQGSKTGFSIKFETQGDTELGVAGVYYAHSNGIDSNSNVK